jgi:hypothetical protein
MFSNAEIQERIQSNGWHYEEVEHTIRTWGLQPIILWTEQDWDTLTIILGGDIMINRLLAPFKAIADDISMTQYRLSIVQNADLKAALEGRLKGLQQEVAHLEERIVKLA